MIRLHNISDQPWVNIAEDRSLVIGSILDDQGGVFPAMRRSIFPNGGRIPDLAPGQAIDVAVHWSSPGSEPVVSAGRYRYQALLVSLKLMSASRDRDFGRGD